MLGEDAAMARSVNYWPEGKCAKAFWGQQALPPYQQLLADTTARLNPRPGDRWLDLGCGRGMLSRAVWEKSGGAVAEVVGLDCAAANAEAYNRLQAALSPTPRPGQIRFVTADFSAGLGDFHDASFDGVVSGLALSYAESYSEVLGRWTTAAYDRVLADVARVLRPGGQFVFSVNVPEPAWHRVAWDALRATLSTRRPHRYLLKSWRIWRYGGWLKREARRGRFHYLPLELLRTKLRTAGFGDCDAALSFSNQAFLIAARRPAVSRRAG